MILTDNVIRSIVQWAEARNLINGATPKDQLTKTIEELGELAGGIARKNQVVIADSIGDVAVTLIILAAQHGMEFSQCLADAYNEIKNRRGRMVDGVFVKEGE